MGIARNRMFDMTDLGIDMVPHRGSVKQYDLWGHPHGGEGGTDENNWLSQAWMHFWYARSQNQPQWKETRAEALDV
jgi:hypothetical protein